MTFTLSFRLFSSLVFFFFFLLFFIRLPSLYLFYSPQFLFESEFDTEIQYHRPPSLFVVVAIPCWWPVVVGRRDRRRYVYVPTVSTDIHTYKRTKKEMRICEIVCGRVRVY